MAKKTNNRWQNPNIHHSDHTSTDIILPKKNTLKKPPSFQNPEKPMEFKSKKNFPTKNLYTLNEFLIKLGIF